MTAPNPHRVSLYLLLAALFGAFVGTIFAGLVVGVKFLLVLS